MNIYRGTELLLENATHTGFLPLLGQAVLEKSNQSFLLVRNDGERLLIAIHDGCILLQTASSCFDHGVSYSSTYANTKIQFQGIRSICEAELSNFVDPLIALNGIRAFFVGMPVSDEVDFKRGLPDRSILCFPDSIRLPRRIEFAHVDKKIDVPAQLRNDMKSVCELLDEQPDGEDECWGDDAIQIGSLCGGQSDDSDSLFSFSYHASSGEVWDFQIYRTIMDSIADGSTTRLAVRASIPKNAG